MIDQRTEKEFIFIQRDLSFTEKYIKNVGGYRLRLNDHLEQSDTEKLK